MSIFERLVRYPHSLTEWHKHLVKTSRRTRHGTPLTAEQLEKTAAWFEGLPGSLFDTSHLPDGEAVRYPTFFAGQQRTQDGDISFLWFDAGFIESDLVPNLSHVSGIALTQIARSWQTMWESPSKNIKNLRELKGDYRAAAGVEAAVRVIDGEAMYWSTLFESSELECAKRLYQAASRRQGGITAIAVDLEFYEQFHEDVIEVGVALRSSELDKDGEWTSNPVKDYHFIIEENRSLRNGLYVVDNQHRFKFGSSKTKREKDVAIWVKDCLTDLMAKERQQTGSHPIFLILHGGTADEEVLPRFGVSPSYAHKFADLKELAALSAEKLAERLAEPLFVRIDTQRLFAAWKRDRVPPKLKDACLALDVTPCYLHNAGNDAEFTMQLFLKLMDRNVDVRFGANDAPPHNPDEW